MGTNIHTITDMPMGTTTNTVMVTGTGTDTIITGTATGIRTSRPSGAFPWICRRARTS